jgi:hypothetical protein
MDSDFLWHTLGGGALITATLTLTRLLLERDERRRGQQRDAEARLERILQDRLAESDRRLERSDADLRTERVHAATLEHELTCMRQAYELLRVEYASLLHADDAQR